MLLLVHITDNNMFKTRIKLSSEEAFFWLAVLRDALDRKKRVVYNKCIKCNQITISGINTKKVIIRFFVLYSIAVDW